MIIYNGTKSDIPAFFSKWFLSGIDEGFVCSKNLYNDDIYTESFLIQASLLDCVFTLMICTLNHYDDIKFNVPSFKGH